MDETSEEDLASKIMALVQKSRVDVEHVTESDVDAVLSGALDEIETLCREFISAQHD